ncbi:hypothetical protein CTAYLR_010450 [Chrysophaeum taylorii]|uniref:Uncharacterized protein n=1 Tax=Chrysophaeum taylorii TaxID=2483200 RepID=A0AAD7U838_9STRA|nr:hypothetical protein CTAYLR_010450 [Chrysophaeum taylorii]
MGNSLDCGLSDCGSPEADESQDYAKPIEYSDAREPKAAPPPKKILSSLEVHRHLKEYYEAWKNGTIQPKQLEMLQKMPVDPATGLLWWQWVERHSGICEHQPPREKPAFLAS